MSLYKQLLIGICLFTFVIFCGNFVVTLESSREQYRNQLSAHAQDAATALGLSLTTHIDEPTMTELMVNSIFDSGYFYRIRVIDIKTNKPIIERSDVPQNTRVPQWFVRLVHLSPGEGDAIGCAAGRRPPGSRWSAIRCSPWPACGTALSPAFYG